MTNDDFYKKLKWLTFFRVLFTTLLLGSTIILQVSETSSLLSKPLLGLYGLIAGIFVLSFCYSLILKIGVAQISARKTRFFLLIFAYMQTSIDTFVVTLIIFMTGSFSSVFSFLYLVVIIYVSMLIFRKGSMIIAALCSIQYGVMIDLEFYGLLNPYGFEAAYYYPWSHVLFKIIMIMVACFAVAFLSSLLAEQERKTKKELLAMEDHVRRVEQMAAVGEMAAGLAHEIKNPIASLRGSIQLLREDIPYDPDHDKLMRIVLREADRLSSLVTDFLLFAKPPAGRMEIFDLGEALAETAAIFEKDIIYRGRISVTTDIVPDIHIEMDPAHLHQIFWNLLLNAAEAIEDSGDIRTEMHPLRNKQIDIRVIDNGCGMSKETMLSIFNPFVTTKPHGTGLGLSIVHRIVESYNGRLDVESEPGRGTVFTLRLKCV
ncbi:ATP-binding protein [Desulfobacterales bacterium HSG2]|nr:ATP-binding protein [Desulfobacterales bacterium HSG2]